MGATIAKLWPHGSQAAAGVCNGNAALCSRLWSDVVMVGSHDSAFVGVLPTQNQISSVTDQLNLGVRFLQAQTHNKDGTIEMCHTYCWELDQGPLTSYLNEIASWMNSHPSDVVTVLLTNQDAIPVSTYATAFQQAGLYKLAYVPSGQPSVAQWPTLQQMIDSGKRLVVFMDYHADTSSVNYILDEFQYYWETPYDVTDKSFPNCNVDRPSGGDPTVLMGIMNHFLDVELVGDILVPDSLDASTTNSAASIEAQAALCKASHGKNPNVILLDYINVGDAMAAQNYFNGL